MPPSPADAGVAPAQSPAHVLALFTLPAAPGPGEPHRWAEIFQATSVALVVTTPADDRIAYATPAYERMHGYRPGELVGLSISDLYSPGERAALSEHIRRADREFVHAFESVHLRSNGTTFPVRVDARAVVDTQGRVLYRVVTCEDLTERERAERRLRESEARLRVTVDHLRLMAEAAEAARRRTERLQEVTAALSRAATLEEVATVVIGQGIAALGGSAGGVVLLSDDGRELVTVKTVGYPEGALSSYLRFPVDRPLPVRDALLTGEPVFLRSAAEWTARYEGPLRTDPGLESAAVLPLRVQDRMLGALTLRFPCVRDFEPEDRALMCTLATQCAQALERAQLHDAQRQARLEAEEANRAKTRFLATMSHELRTPLNAIAGYAELLEIGIHGPLTESQRHAVRRVQHSGRHLLARINDLLSFARLEAGYLEMHPAEVPLDEALAGVEALVEPQLRARAQHFTRAGLDPDLRAWGDPDKVGQVLLNLLSNAVKFTPPGGSIRVEGAAEGDRVLVRVHDTGVGIAADQLEQVFQPFVQLDHSLTGAHEGTGLGLAISRDLARAMGGDLTAASTPGLGSTFTLTLPRSGG